MSKFYEPDPNRKGEGLERFAIFSILVAGKNADTMEVTVESMCDKFDTLLGMGPFEAIRQLDLLGEGVLAAILKASGVGCYTDKARALSELANADLDLRECTVEQLEGIWGIGPKTARFFVLFSREDVDDVAVLDVHVLRWLSEQGYDVPVSTPGSSARYREIEEVFLAEWRNLHEKVGISLAAFDYAVWKKQRGAEGDY